MLAHIVLISLFLLVSFGFSFAPDVLRQRCNDSNLWFKSYEHFDFLFCMGARCDVPNHDSCPNHMNNYHFYWMRFGKNVLTPCRNFIKPHYGLANSWIQIVDFLKSWMHPRAPDATVFLIGKRNRALDYVWGLTDYCYNVADAQIDDWCQQCNV